MARLVISAPYFKAMSSRSRGDNRLSSRSSRSASDCCSACSSGVRAADGTAAAASSGTSGRRARSVIDRDVAGDREQPGGKAGHVLAVAIARAPGFFERPGGQVLGIRRVADPVAEEVEHARQFFRVDLIPIRFCRHPAGQPPGQHLLDHHLRLFLYTEDHVEVSHARVSSPFVHMTMAGHGSPSGWSARRHAVYFTTQRTLCI